jgi:aspartokinase-like uncharacterized kinase
MLSGPVVIKVGGSLFDLTDFGPRLQTLLNDLAGVPLLLVPGGGPTADVIRALDHFHHLGEETAHWLALRALTVNAWVLAALVPSLPTRVVGPKEEWQCAWNRGEIAILDAHAFAFADEGQPGCLPHRWSVTSDSVAARAAVVASARELVLLKSSACPPPGDLQKAVAAGHVDAFFAAAAGSLSAVRMIDFRAG